MDMKFGDTVSKLFKGGSDGCKYLISKVSG